jgi:hypothetical protein
VEFGVDIDCEYMLCMHHVYSMILKSMISNMEGMQNFEVVLDKFKTDRICTRVLNSSQK